MTCWGATKSLRRTTKSLRLQPFHYSNRGHQVSRATVDRWCSAAKAKLWVWPDCYTIDTVRDMQSLLTGIVPGTVSNRASLYNCHFAFNTQSNKILGSDGYDNYQAPLGTHGEELFSRRMWVNGSIEYFQGSPALDQKIDCVETISSAKYLSSNVFVKISRIFTDRCTQLKIMKETRSIMYTNRPYKRDTAPRPTSLTECVKSCNASVSLEQQIRFSSLTSNLHKIHCDIEHCRKENFPQVVVSGPLLVLIMLHYFTCCYPRAVIRELSYRNSEPCFVDDIFKIALFRARLGWTIVILRNSRVLCEGTFTHT